jgi:hypothetical protein
VNATAGEPIVANPSAKGSAANQSYVCIAAIFAAIGGLTKSVALGPDLEVTNRPTYVGITYTTALLGMRMSVMF